MKNNKAKEFLLMNLGIVLLSVGVYFFKIPNGFSTGGVSGAGTILGAVTPITPATWILIINMTLLVVGFIFLGRTTGIRTVYCSVVYSLLTWAFEWIFPMTQPLTDQTFLELVYAILLTAIGSAMMFNCRASSGGTDILALILKKYTSLDIGKALLYVDVLIAGSSFFVFGIKIGLFSMLGLFAKAFLVDSVIESLNSCKYFIIITSKPDEIREYILKNMHHGATQTAAVGAFTHENKTMLHTVCRRIEAIRLQRYVRAVDPHSFIIVTTSSEIIGRGFRSV